MAADVVVIPTIMSVGFLKQVNRASAADGPGAAKRIFGAVGDEDAGPPARSRGWMFLAKTGNTAAIKLGTADVRDAGADEGFPRSAEQVLTGAITDPAAKEVFQVAADAAQNFYCGMVG